MILLIKQFMGVPHQTEIHINADIMGAAVELRANLNPIDHMISEIRDQHQRNVSSMNDGSFNWTNWKTAAFNHWLTNCWHCTVTINSIDLESRDIQIIRRTQFIYQITIRCDLFDPSRNFGHKMRVILLNAFLRDTVESNEPVQRE
jgi:hypothetical protein